MYTHSNFLKSHPLATRPMRATSGVLLTCSFAAKVPWAAAVLLLLAALAYLAYCHASQEADK